MLARRLTARARALACAAAWLYLGAAFAQSPPPRSLDPSLVHVPERRGALFELHGYLRFRSDLFSNFTFGGSADPALANLARFFTPFGERNPNSGLAQPELTRADDRTVASASMRLRLEPTLNVHDDVRVKAQLDVLDNLTLGSTPEGFPNPSGFAPLSAFTPGAVPPSDGVNALKDSVRVKRAWGEVDTPFGLFAFGRMPAHFGMGIYANRGDCMDCDYGDSFDRFLFLSKLIGHYFGLFVDFASEGLTSDVGELVQRSRGEVARRGAFIDRYLGRPFDLDQRDDVTQYGLMFMRTAAPAEVKEKVENGESLTDYGLMVLFRNQGRTTENRGYTTSGRAFQGRPDQSDLSRQPLFERRGASYWVFDPWLKYTRGRFVFEAEATLVVGALDVGPSGESLDIFQYGGVLRASNGFLNGALEVSLEAGIASGADGRGLTLRDEAGVSPVREVSGTRRLLASANNFKFDPDYQLDRILFREIVGAFTSAWYAKPTAQYNFSDGFALRVSMIYSNAVNGRQWPGASVPESAPGRGDGGCGGCPLGLETNIDLIYRYKPNDFLYAQFGYAGLLPFHGLRASAPMLSSYAQTLYTRLVLRY